MNRNCHKRWKRMKPETRARVAKRGGFVATYGAQIVQAVQSLSEGPDTEPDRKVAKS